MIQQTVFGLGIFTKEASARFRYRGPPGSDVPGSDTYSMISDSFARNTLREACSAVHDSLEFDEAVDVVSGLHDTLKAERDQVVVRDGISGLMVLQA